MSPVYDEKFKSWLTTYKLIILIFGYIVAITMIGEMTHGEFAWMRWMNNFMAGFFLIFSFLKMLNLKSFAESYSMHDIVGKKWNGWWLCLYFF